MLKKYGGEKAAQELIRDVERRKKEVLGKALEMEKLYGRGEEEDKVVERVTEILKGKDGLGNGKGRQEMIDLLEKEFLGEDIEEPNEELFDQIMKRGGEKMKAEVQGLVEKLKNNEDLDEKDLIWQAEVENGDDSINPIVSAPKREIEVKKSSIALKTHP